MRTNLFLTAALATASFSFLPNGASAQTAADRAGNALERAGDAVHRAADKLTGSTTNPANALAPDAEDIRETLRTSIEASLTKGGFDDLIERFVNADRTRLGKDSFVKQDHTTLDGRIAQFQKDWKAKYNQDFKIKDKEAVYSAAFATIIQSEVPGGARLASERQNGAANPTIPVQPDNNQAQVQRDASKVGGGDTNLNPGRNIAVVQVAASHGLPALTVPLIHELPDSWKIDVPDNYTATQMHDNLLKHLTMADDMKDQWPADVNEAYRVVTHHVLMAVLNVDQNGSNMNNMNGMPSNAGGMNNNNLGTTPNNNTATPGAR